MSLNVILTFSRSQYNRNSTHPSHASVSITGSLKGKCTLSDRNGNSVEHGRTILSLV